MSAKGAEAGDRSTRIITKVVVSYRLKDDPPGTEQRFTIAHGGDGEVIDGIIWSETLVRKLAYLENGLCTAAKTQPGTGDWEVDMPEAELRSTARAARNCVWLHGDDCTWSEFCSPD